MVIQVIAQAPAVKIADLKDSKGCWGLDLELLTWDTTQGNSITFAIGPNAKDLLNGAPQQVSQSTLHAGFYGNGFTMPDLGQAEVFRSYNPFADELWVRNFGPANTPPAQVDVEVYRIS